MHFHLRKPELHKDTTFVICLSLQVPKFDDFLASVQAPVNNVVDITTSINECIDDIRDAATMVLGNYLVEIDLNASSQDHFHVQINKVPVTPAPNPPLTADQLHEELQKVVADEKFKTAEKALSDARTALYAANASFTLGAAGTPDEGKLVGAGTEAVNAALASMREALGSAYKLGITIKASPLPGARTVGARIVKACAPSDDSSDYKMVPLASYDVYKSKEAKAMIGSQILIDEAAGLLAKRLKAADDAGVKYTLELLNKRRVKLVVEAPPPAEGEEAPAAAAEGDGEGEEGAAKPAGGAAAPEKPELEELRKAVLVLNHQLFKLQKAAGAANGPVNLSKAITIMINSIIAKAKKLAGDSSNITVSRALLGRGILRAVEACGVAA